jgi:hypothetical protein
MKLTQPGALESLLFALSDATMREFEEIVTVPSTMRRALATVGQHGRMPR